MHRLIASPFLEQHLLVRPGSRGGDLLPTLRYEELRALDPAERSPSWLADSLRAGHARSGSQSPRYFPRRTGHALSVTCSCS